MNKINKYVDYTLVIYAQFKDNPQIYIQEFEMIDLGFFVDLWTNDKKEIILAIEEKFFELFSYFSLYYTKAPMIHHAYKFTRYFYNPMQIISEEMPYFEPTPDLTPDRYITIENDKAHYTDFPVYFQINNYGNYIEITGIANEQYPLANYAYLTASARYLEEYGSLDGVCSNTKLSETMSHTKTLTILIEQEYKKGYRFVPLRGNEIMRAIMFKVAGVEENKLLQITAYFIETRTQAAIRKKQPFETTLGARTYTAALTKFKFPISDYQFIVNGYDMNLLINY